MYRSRMSLRSCEIKSALHLRAGLAVPREPLARAGTGFLGFDLPVARGGGRLQRRQQPPRGAGDLLDGAIEGCRIGLRRPVEPGELAHELQGGGADIILARRRIEVEQRSDVAAHDRSPVRRESAVACDYCKSPG